MASPFQPLTAKNFLAVKSVPVPDSGSGGGINTNNGNGRGAGTPSNGGIGRGLLGGKTMSRRIVSSSSSSSYSTTPTTTASSTRQSPSISENSISHLGTEELLAGLPQLPYGQQSAETSTSSGGRGTLTGGSGPSSSTSPFDASMAKLPSSSDHSDYHGRNHESSISNIIRERDIAAQDRRQQQQQRRADGPKQKVRFDHLHQSCPVIVDGIKGSKSGSSEFKLLTKGDDSVTSFPTSSNHSNPEQQERSSSPRSTVDRQQQQQQQQQDTNVDLTRATRRGISLQNLPFSSSLQQTLLLRREQSKDVDSDFAIETMRGDKIATIESPAYLDGTQDETWERCIRDVEGNVYAVILQSIVEGGSHRFKICSHNPMFTDQRKSRESGLYTYADVKNSSGIGVKFTMKLRGDNSTKFVTESFGPSIFQWGRRGQSKGARGFIIKKIADGEGKKPTDGKEVARITFLGAGKAISIGPNQDFRLIIAFATIIDEMVEKRLR